MATRMKPPGLGERERGLGGGVTASIGAALPAERDRGAASVGIANTKDGTGLAERGRDFCGGAAGGEELAGLNERGCGLGGTVTTATDITWLAGRDRDFGVGAAGGEKVARLDEPGCRLGGVVAASKQLAKLCGMDDLGAAGVSSAT